MTASGIVKGFDFAEHTQSQLSQINELLLVGPLMPGKARSSFPSRRGRDNGR